MCVTNHPTVSSPHSCQLLFSRRFGTVSRCMVTAHRKFLTKSRGSPTLVLAWSLGGANLTMSRTCERGWASFFCVTLLSYVHTLCFTYKVLQSGEPETLASVLQVNGDLRQRNTRQYSMLCVSRSRTEVGNRRVSSRLPRLYNSMPVGTLSWDHGVSAVRLSVSF